MGTSENRDPVDQAPYALREQLGFKLSRTARRMQQRLEAELAPHGMNRIRWCVLSGIGLEGLTAPSQIAANMGVKRPTISKALKSMVADGLILSIVREEDGRARDLALTRKGQDLLEICHPIVARNAQRAAAPLSPAHLAQIHALLDLLQDGEEDLLDHL